MDLGVFVGYWQAGPPVDALEQILAAERLGFRSVWTAEAYGSDAFTPLAWWGSQTSTIRLGTGIAQMAARTPAATAMAALTLDHLSGGRMILGLGASGPQVVEGWYGRPYDKPLAMTREYVEVIRRIFARETPLEFEGDFFQLPLRGGSGGGKPLKSTVHPLRRDLPIYLAAQGPKNVALAAEICDGWLPFWFSPSADDFYRAALDDGFTRRASGRSPDGFEIAAPVAVVPNPDREAGAEMIRPLIALYVGGMGSRGANFHRDVFLRMGYEEECARIEEFYLSGDKVGAARAVSLEMVEEVALVGSAGKIRDDLARWEESVVTTLLVQGPPPLLEMVAELVS